MNITMNGYGFNLYHFAVTQISRFIKEPYHNRYRITVCVKADRKLNDEEKRKVLKQLEQKLNEIY